MSRNHKWNIRSKGTGPARVVLFVSRNKDNKNLEDFKERRRSFVSRKTDDELQDEFRFFCEDSKPGEMCRMYVSVNARDMKKVNKELIHYLIDNPDFDLEVIESKIAAIASQKECAAEKKWMFDFDSDNRAMLDAFLNDIKKIDDTVKCDLYMTPNGYAVVCNHGFDTRNLLSKWGGELKRLTGESVELKRDDLVCVYWYQDISHERHNTKSFKSQDIER